MLQRFLSGNIVNTWTDSYTTNAFDGTDIRIAKNLILK
jgi:hypothetical protein